MRSQTCPRMVRVPGCWSDFRLSHGFRHGVLAAENQQLMAPEGAITMLVGLLDTPHELTQRQAAKALANLGVDAGNKIEIAKQGALPRLFNIVKNSGVRVKTEAVAAIANLAVDGEWLDCAVAFQ